MVIYKLYFKMLNLIVWKKITLWDFVFIKNEFFWIKWYYFWNKYEGEFILYPFLDTNHNTFYYAIFDNFKQYEIFSKLIKISGVGMKTANYIATFFDLEEIKKAIDNVDIEFFTQITGIWPKTAKKILVELKDKIILEDLDKTQKLSKLKEKIISTLVNLWYSKSKVEKLLKDYTWNLENISEVIQYLIKKL